MQNSSATWPGRHKPGEIMNMTIKIYNTDTKATHDLTIDVNGCDAAGDILGNMDIGSSLHNVARDEDDLTAGDAAEAAAYEAGANYYGDTDECQWWIDYVNGYNATRDDMDTVADLIDDSDLTAEDVCDKLGLRYQQGYAQSAINDWLTGDSVDYDTERSAFVSNFDALKAVL
jgi:hypothetical protein